MAGLRDRVTELMTMLDGLGEEAKNASGTTERLSNWFDQEPKRLIAESLEAILNEVRKDAPKEPFRPHLVLMSPRGRVSTWSNYQERPPEYRVLSIFELSRLIDSLKSQVAKGKWIPAVEFIKANKKISPLPVRPVAPIRRSKPTVTEKHDEPGWKLSDFLPALPPHPPLPRGLFKD